MKHNFFAELIARFQLESPTFFKKIQTICYSAAGIIQALVAFKAAGVDLGVFTPYVNEGSMIIAVIGALLAKTPVCDNDALHAKLNKDTTSAQ